MAAPNSNLGPSENPPARNFRGGGRGDKIIKEQTFKHFKQYDYVDLNTVFYKIIYYLQDNKNNFIKYRLKTKVSVNKI